jgi:hypothetical protein
MTGIFPERFGLAWAASLLDAELCELPKPVTGPGRRPRRPIARSGSWGKTKVPEVRDEFTKEYLLVN